VLEGDLSICGCNDGSIYLGGSCSQQGSCPAGMSWINSSTCIDDLEFSVSEFLVFLNGLGSACDDPGPTCTACGGQRCFPSDASNPWHYDDSDPGWWVEGDVALGLNYPARFMTFDAAKSACQSVGKHLCSADEWENSCGGISGRDYPYGSQYQPGICEEGGGFAARPSDRGERAQCANLEHPSLRDQSGNVWEWTNSCSGSTCMVRGGSYAVDGSFFPSALGCHFDQGHERGSAEFDIGFRCCASPL
jgi:formylglycine-generating enzyme required for sulfatase activity